MVQKMSLKQILVHTQYWGNNQSGPHQYLRLESKTTHPQHTVGQISDWLIKGNKNIMKNK